MNNGITAGIDIGSTTTKAIILCKGRIAASAITATGASPRRSAEDMLHKALAQASLTTNDVTALVSTGYGRRLVEFADKAVSEITAHARGACHLYHGIGTLRTIIDLGGQDSKAISLDADGILEDFVMNDKCAAGTGRFLEVMARALGVELDQLGELSLQADPDNALQVNSLCTVFAESEVISLIARGENIHNIIAGIHASIARRIASMARRVGVHEPAMFSGGPANNSGLQAALAKELGIELTVPQEPQLVAALGAAIVAQSLID